MKNNRYYTQANNLPRGFSFFLDVGILTIFVITLNEYFVITELWSILISTLLYIFYSYIEYKFTTIGKLLFSHRVLNPDFTKPLFWVIIIAVSIFGVDFDKAEMNSIKFVYDYLLGINIYKIKHKTEISNISNISEIEITNSIFKPDDNRNVKNKFNYEETLKTEQIKIELNQSLTETDITLNILENSKNETKINKTHSVKNILTKLKTINFSKIKTLKKLTSDEVIIISIIIGSVFCLFTGNLFGETQYYLESGERTKSKYSNYTKIDFNYIIAIISFIVTAGISYIFLNRKSNNTN
jgi:hypothetical protein